MKPRRFGFPVPIDDTCVLYMPFEDNFGLPYLDKSQYANHGTRFGAVQWNGIRYLGLSFDGLDDYVAVAHSASLNCSAVSIMGWVKLDAAWAAAGHVLAKCEDSGAQYSYALAVTAARKLQLGISDDGAAGTAETATAALATGRWYHVAATFEETIPPAAGTYRLYVDGVVVASDGLGVEPSIHAGTGRLTAGARWDSSDAAAAEVFKGLLDDVLVFNRILLAQELYDLWSVHAGDNTRE